MWLLVACALLVAVSANDLRPHLEVRSVLILFLAICYVTVCCTTDILDW